MASLTPTTRRVSDRLFYLGMSLAVAILSIAGFARSYYLSFWFEPPRNVPQITWLIHLHGLIFTAWILLQPFQSFLIFARKPFLHRKIGYSGAVLAALMVFSGNMVALEAMDVGFIGARDPHVFYAVPFFAINAFALVIILAITWRNRPEIHKRLILLSNVAILPAVIARLPIGAVQSAAPWSSIFGPDLIIAAGILYDWRTRRRIHWVWLYGGAAMIASQVLMWTVMRTDGWRWFASTLDHLS